MRKLHICTDRQFLFNPSITVLMKLSVNGSFNQTQFEKALQTLKNVHPLLYSSIRFDSDGEAYYYEKSVEQLELSCVKREHQNHWLEVAESEYKRPFNIEKGPLIRFFVFYGEADFDILAVVQHVVGDGDAISRLLRDLVAAYAGIDLAFQEQKIISNEQDFPLQAKPTLSVKVLTIFLNKQWSSGTQPRFGQDEYQKLFSHYHQKVDIGLFYSTIDPSKLNDLYRACKAHNVTINEAIVTAFIYAMQKHHNGKKITVGIPINIRKQLSFSVDACLGNFASAITITEHYDTSKSFWQNAERIQRKSTLKLKSPTAHWVVLNFYAHMKPLLVDAMYFAAYGKCNDKAAIKAAKMLSIDKPSSTAVSNLGRLNFDCQIGSYRIRDLVFLAPKAPVSYAVLGIATLDGAMQIGFSYDRKIISHDTMRDVSSTMIELLDSVK